MFSKFWNCFFLMWHLVGTAPPSLPPNLANVIFLTLPLGSLHFKWKNQNELYNYFSLKMIIHWSRGGFGLSVRSALHYMCDLKSHQDGLWYHTSDAARPRPLRLDEVSKKAFIVLYKRVSKWLPDSQNFQTFQLIFIIRTWIRFARIFPLQSKV